MSSVFSSKPNRSYYLRDLADKRTKFLEQQVASGQDKELADNQRIIADYELQLKKDAQNERDRMTRNKTIAAMTREY